MHDVASLSTDAGRWCEICMCHAANASPLHKLWAEITSLSLMHGYCALLKALRSCYIQSVVRYICMANSCSIVSPVIPGFSCSFFVTYLYTIFF